jgi:hypothetical protein
VTWILQDKELESVLSLSGGDRYGYFVKRVADSEEVWSLAADDGWALAGGGERSEAVPVWPHPRYATACAVGQWARYGPRSIPLRDWLDKWTPGMARDGRMVAVFPVPEDRGVVVAPEHLQGDIERELARME